MSRYTLADIRATTLKPKDAWWTVFLVDPLAIRLCLPIANRTSLTPNAVSAIALLFGLGASVSFGFGTTVGLVAGAGLYHLSFVLDCVDGKIARLKGTGSFFGIWLDYIFDRVRVLACSVGLFSGLYRETDDVTYLYLGIAVIFLDMLRYMDALQVAKLRREMRDAILEVRGDAAPARAQDAGEEEADDAEGTVAPAWYFARFKIYRRVRERLVAARVRPHLFSGVEFQMFVFIVAPLSRFVKPVVIGSAALLLVFESLIIYRLLLWTRQAERRLERLEAARDGSPPEGV